MSLREELALALAESRAFTRDISAGLDDAGARAQPDTGLSPIGWHLGHVIWTEETWVAGSPGEDAALWSSFQSRKLERARRLPGLERIRAHGEVVRERTLAALATADLDDARLRWMFRFLANHERQHAETVAVARIAAGLFLPAPPLEKEPPSPARFVPVPGGTFALGCDDDPEGWDNERRAHAVELAPFEIAQRPVTCAEWESFVQAGGYRDRRLWSDAGWEWVQRELVAAPRFWEGAPGSFSRRTLAGMRPVVGSHPVAHVSWFEAEAFARFASARLPTEAEWERAASFDGGADKRRYPAGATPGDASLGAIARDTTPAGARPQSRSALGLDDLCGNVWEWTASTFAPYPGFASDPYDGYSVPWFDGRHRVLRGGCHLTQPVIARAAFRNWFEPGVRAFPSGLRLARSA